MQFVDDWVKTNRGHSSIRRQKPRRHDLIFNEVAPPGYGDGYIDRIDGDGFITVAYKIWDNDSKAYFSHRIVREYPIEKLSGRLVETRQTDYWSICDEQVDWAAQLALALSKC